MMRSCCQSSVMARRTAFGDFSAQRMSKRCKGGVALFQLLVCLHGQLRNLAGAGQLRASAPVAVASESINVRQNPSSDYIIRLLTGVTKQI